VTASELLALIKVYGTQTRAEGIAFETGSSEGHYRADAQAQATLARIEEALSRALQTPQEARQ
jgi:hypothetical protein